MKSRKLRDVAAEAQAQLNSLDVERHIRRAQTATADAKRSLAAALLEIDRLENEKTLLLALDDKRRAVEWARPKLVDRGEAAAILITSDWHVEEEVLPESVNGLNKWTLSIAEKSIEELFKRTVLLVNRYRSMAKIEEMVVGLLGDMITGFLRPEQIRNNSLSPIEACQFVEDRAVAGIDYLLKHGNFKRLTIVTCVGNHGRTTEKMWATGRTETSYETLVYQHMRRRVTDNRVQWQIGDGEFAYLNVYGKRLRFLHGDTFKYKGGVGGLSVPVNRAIQLWDSGEGAADYTFFGDKHTFHWNAPARWVCNGSLIGVAPYSLKYGFSQPCQALAILDRERGVTDVTKVFVR